MTTSTSEVVTIPATLPFTRDKVKAALTQTHGNVGLAARMLGVAESTLDREVELSKKLRDYFIKLRKKQNHVGITEYRNLSLKTVLEDIERKRTIYRSEAIDAIREIATMPISENSAMMQVKLLAAVRLYNETGEKGVGDTIHDTLKALNDEFHSTAKRISVVRERATVTIEAGSSTYESSARELPG
jgi:formylmethanofuran dehydrogenase subunit E-like metal-binding protein